MRHESNVFALSENLWLADGKIEATLGSRVDGVIKDLCRYAKAAGTPCTVDFNGHAIRAKPTSDPAVLTAAWYRESEARSAAYLASPTYAESQRQYEEKMAKKRAEYDEMIALAPAEPTWADSKMWQSWVDANHDAYGAATIRYARDWARLMESVVVAGIPVSECAERLSHVADIDGVSGTMHGFALSMLAQAWIHGPALAEAMGRKQP